MTLRPLRPDALSATASGLELRVSLPWIRSLPLASISDLTLRVDGAPEHDIRVILGDRVVGSETLQRETGWWFIQDRLVVAAPARIDRASHIVELSFTLMIPYLAGPAGPLRLPFHAREALTARRGSTPPGITRDVA